MENILTFAGFSQVVLTCWVMEWIASVPSLILGALIFGFLVAAIRDVLKEAQGTPKRRGVARGARVDLRRVR